MSIRHVTSVFALLIMLSCTMTVPETRIYSIHVRDGVSRQRPRTDAVLLVNVSAEDHLRQPFIVRRISPYEMSLDRNAKWEAPPVRIVREKIAAAFADSGLFRQVRPSGISEGDAYVMEIDLRNFDYLDEGGSGAALLVYDFSLFYPDGRLAVRDGIEMRKNLGERGYGALARGLSTALQEAISLMVQEITEKVD